MKIKRCYTEKRKHWKEKERPCFRKSRGNSRLSHMISVAENEEVIGCFGVATKVSSASLSRNVALRKLFDFCVFCNKHLRVCKLWRRDVFRFGGPGKTWLAGFTPRPQLSSCGLVCPPQFDVFLPWGPGDQQLLPGVAKYLQPALLWLCEVLGSCC